MKRTLSWLLWLVLSGCSVQIQHGLDERDANEIIAELVSRGFEARKVPEKGKKPTWAIELADARATDALRVLTELKLPRPPRLKTQALAQSGGLIDTPGVERLRQLEAQEGDIEESLETLDGVTSAAVELVVPAAPRPGQPAVPSKAAVLIRVQPLAVERLTLQRAELRALVAGAVDGLHSDDVVLVIDQVSLPPVAPRLEQPGLRPLVVVLGVALSALALVLVLLALRLRTPHVARKVVAASPPVSARPVLSPALNQRGA